VKDSSGNPTGLRHESRGIETDSLTLVVTPKIDIMEEKNNCCGGCKNGKPGQNSACKAKIMIEAIAEKTAHTEMTSTNTLK